METVINKSSANGHIINKYNFKVLPSGPHKSIQTEDKEFASASFEKAEEEPVSTEDKKNVETHSAEKSTKDELIESLLKKTDELSSNFIKMQMKLEDKEEEYKKALKEEKAKAFEEGQAAGIKEAKEVFKAKHDSLTEQFSASIKTLQKSTQEFENSIEGIKEELIHAALDIAKEVILVEISERGNEIAKTLAESLISEIKNSASVTIKVNPNNKVSIEQSLGTLDNIKILSDNAVSSGGVIILSDAGNIDGDIMKRYERVKNVALSR